jgi:murein DD-endopeptidase MepM/ murein hydrolase activator NlpD
MSRIGKGIRPGRKVRQGETIGYVGSTGLATGPHVCYRFWRDGKQVDPFRQSLKFSDALGGKEKTNFLAQTKSLRTTIDGLAYDADPLKKIEEERQAKITTAANSFVERMF